MSVALVHERANLWERVDALIDRAPSHADLRRPTGWPAPRRAALPGDGAGMPADFRREERAAAVAALTAPVVLERVVAAIDADCILLKGPEAARRYPDPGLRGFGDLDVLSRDAPAAQRALLAAGFTAVGDPHLYEDIHHLRPLVDAGLRLPIEVHAAPKWVAPLRPPSVHELFEAAVPSAVGVPGVLGLPPSTSRSSSPCTRGRTSRCAGWGPRRRRRHRRLGRPRRGHAPREPLGRGAARTTTLARWTRSSTTATCRSCCGSGARICRGRANEPSWRITCSGS